MDADDNLVNGVDEIFNAHAIGAPTAASAVVAANSYFVINEVKLVDVADSSKSVFYIRQKQHLVFSIVLKTSQL